MEKINYNETGKDKSLVLKGENLRKVIEDVLGGDDVYKLLGVTTKKMIYDRGVRTITHNVKPVKVTKVESSLDELTSNQRGFFGNLNNLKELDYLSHFNNKFVVLPDNVDQSAFILIMASKTTDSLSRQCIEKVGVTFRRYTDEEKEEYLQRIAARESQDLGYSEDNSLDDLYADTDF